MQSKSTQFFAVTVASAALSLLAAPVLGQPAQPLTGNAVLGAPLKAVGTLQRIDSKNRLAFIAHEPVPQLNWPAMTMHFGVPDGWLLAGVSPGQRIRFAFAARGDGYDLVAIENNAAVDSLPATARGQADELRSSEARPTHATSGSHEGMQMDSIPGMCHGVMCPKSVDHDAAQRNPDKSNEHDSMAMPSMGMHHKGGAMSMGAMGGMMGSMMHGANWRERASRWLPFLR